MRPARGYEYTPEQSRLLKKAARLEWLTLGYVASVVVLMYLVLGESQAMKSAWVEDLLALLPPAMFLFTNRFRNRPPNEHFPYGFHRAASIGFLIAAVALVVVGGWLVVDSGLKLFKQEHPTIGMKEFFGIDLWLGWWMIAVLVYGTFIPILLGRAKLKLVKPLYDKILYTDAKMNKADWLTAVAAIAGVLGIGMGLWWADAVAALIIAFDIVHDGVKQLHDALTGLIDRAPKTLEGEYEDIPAQVVQTLESLDWVDSAEVRLREEGHLFFGEGYFVSRDDRPVAPEQLRAAVARVKALDWRLQDFALTPMTPRR